MYTGPNIITDGLVLALDAANVKSFPGEPTTNLLYNNGIVDWSIVNLTVNVSRTTITENSKYRITSTSYINAYTFGAFRMYVPLASLINGLTYTMSFKWKFISGSPGFSMTDWNDTSLFNVINTSYADYNYASATGVHSVYDTTYRFMDFSIPANTVIEIWDVQLEQKLYATAFVNGTRGTTVATGGGWADKSGNNNHGALVNGPTYDSANGGSIVFDGINDYVIMPTSTNIWTDDFTINFTIKLNIIGNQFIFSNGPYGGPSTNVWFNGSNQYSFTVHIRKTDGTGSIGYNFTLPTTYLNLNTYNLVYSSTFNTLTLFQNKMLIETKATSLIDPSWMPNGWRIGNSSNAYNVNGNLYNFNVYNKSLTAEEVLQNYNAQKGRFGL